MNFEKSNPFILQLSITQLFFNPLLILSFIHLTVSDEQLRLPSVAQLAGFNNAGSIYPLVDQAGCVRTGDCQDETPVSFHYKQQVHR